MKTMKMKARTTAVVLLMLLTAIVAVAQDKPQLKVDVSITNRQAQEVQEPGYTLWQVKQGKEDTLTVEGIKCTLCCAADADYEIRTGWSKTYVQNAAYKEQNGRLTFDGLSLDPRKQGTIVLRLEGLPVGEHSLQTYHNCWENPANFYASPMTVKLNGTVVQENVQPSFLQSVAANATIVISTFTIGNVGDIVELEFSTSADQHGTPDNGQANEFTAPLINGFELNTVNVTTMAKEPYPANNDMHVDADDGSVTLSWSPASGSVKQHRIYFGESEDALTLLATQTDTTYTVDALYSMNTYYWRVDEVRQDDTEDEGQVWCFKPRQLAFPGAEGYGRFAQGGRGGSVYHVTSLSNDNVPGTLKYGLVSITEPHTIVFDVSGLIVMDFGSLFAKSNITIAAQTAPGKGICLKASNINIGSDNICRFLRFKRGLGVYGENTGNAMGMSGADHTIVDHCMAAWGTDETVSGRGAKNISFQYNIISEALGIAGHKNYADGTNHGYAATIDGKVGSYHHNLLVNCNGRNWSMGGGMDGNNTAIGQMDIFNNVVYNWNGRTTDGGCHEVNFVGNYYKMGPDTRRTELFIQQYENVGSIESKWQAYVSGNIRENKNHTQTQDKYGVTYKYSLSNGATDPNTRTDEYAYKTFVDQPFFPSYADIHTADDAFKIVTSYAGATMPVRDEHHQRNVRETVDGTYTYVGSKSGIKGEIDSEADITEHENGWELFPEETREAGWDTDQDGMPDWWEKVVGSNPDVANHNDDPDHDGWTLLEDYLEFMAHSYLIMAPGGSGSLDLKVQFAGFYGKNGQELTPTYTVGASPEGFDVGIDGSTLRVKAAGTECVGWCEVTVDDGETSFTQRFGVVVSGDPSAIQTVKQDADYTIVRREFFTLDGKKTERLLPTEVYLMKATDSEGRIHWMKMMKN